MRYQFKSILKNKLTWVFFLILLIFNLYTRINMEVLGNVNWRKTSTYFELSAMKMKDILNSERDYAQSQLDIKDQNLENYYKYREWLISNAMGKSKFSQETNISFDDNRFYVISIQEIMVLMNENADPEKDRPYAEDIFRQELNQVKSKLELRELPFDSHKLHYVNKDSELVRNTVYDGCKIELNRLFYLILHEEKALETGTLSPWALLVQKISIEESSTIIIPIVCLIYSASLVIEDKKNRSIKLVETLPRNRNYVVIHYYISTLWAVIIILLLSFGIPMLAIGFKHGFMGLNNPILVDPKGFISFTGYSHSDDWGCLGLSKFFASVSLPEYDKVFPSSQLVFYPLWKVFALATIPSILKIMFYTLLGVTIAMCSKKNSFATPITGFFSIFTVISQLYWQSSLFNPFSISTGWNVTIGVTSFTWLRGVVVLSVAWIVLFFFTLFHNQRHDFVD